MDFYNTRDTYILCKGNASLWCNRVNGNLQVRPASAIEELQIEPKCLGTVYGVVGKIKFLPGSDDKLVLITKRYEVGKLTDESPIYRIEKVAVVPLSSDECPEIDFDSCDEHSDPSTSKQAPQPRVAQTFNNLKTSLANQFKATANKTNFQKTSDKDVTRDKEKMEKLERRLQEEFVKMFNYSQSFYYSERSDLTNTVQRNVQKDDESKKLPIWKTADERFFWNKAMLEEIIALTESDASANEWIVPIIQGYVQTALCEVDYSESGMNQQMLMQMAAEKFDLILISRRSVSRAGTRYKRRGIDEDGNVANYVETEQIVRAGAHYLSFVQLRGSIPLYWSQAGIKYRPPPKLERNKEESQHAMKKHLEKELALYKNVTIVNLVEQSGREQVLYDAFMEHIITYDNPLLTYVTFDFHEYCRGMKFENVSKLVETVADITEVMRFSWVDNHGVIWEQQGVFRVNCMDCLDRTNVVQAALARYVLETQLSRLGRLMPESSLPADIRDIYQDMWANNGDAISRQYAGTAAMKGDFTRTGERKFTGVMKDGYHSANRYLNRFTAAYRQTVIDIMLGIPPTEDITLLIAAMKQLDDTGEEWTLQREEWVAQLVEQCHQLLVHEGELYLGGWALIEPLVGSDGEGSDFEQEVVLLLTEKAFYIASYDEEEECVNQYEYQPLGNLEKIEIGTDLSQRSPNPALRLHYRNKEESGYFHTFKALQNRTVDEDKDVLNGVADEFRKASLVINLNPKVLECRLNKKKSKPHDIIQLSCKTRPCSADSHYRCKKASCSPKIPSMVHSSSAPAQLDKMAAPRVNTTTIDNSKTNTTDQGTITDTSCSANKSGLYKRNLSAGSATRVGDTLEGFKIPRDNLEGEFLSDRTKTNDDISRSVDISKSKIGDQEVNLREKPKDRHSNENNDDIRLERNVEPNFDEAGKVVQSSLHGNSSSQDSRGGESGQKAIENTYSVNEAELNNAEILLCKDNGEQSASKGQNFSESLEQDNLDQTRQQKECRPFETDKEAIKTKDVAEKQSAISSDVNIGRRENFDESTEGEISEEVDQSETNSTGKSLMSRLVESGKKLSSAHNSPKATRKAENLNKTSNDSAKESETSSGLAANIKKNFKNRFADVSIRFRKNDDSVNTSELRWQSDDSEGVPEPARPDGKRNILAAAQERGRAFIPELKNKFSGLSNRSPRLGRKRDWEKVIQESGCSTKIIQI